MKKEFNAYMSVEASFIFSTIIFIYYLVIMSSLLLMNRTLSFQNDYIIGMRCAGFSDAREEYGEIIYGVENTFDINAYACSRFEKIKNTYICFPQKSYECYLDNNNVVVNTEAGNSLGKNNNEIHCYRINPVKRIREQRY